MKLRYVLTRILEEFEHTARRFVCNGSLAFHLIFPCSIPSCNLVFRLDQNQSGLVQYLKYLFCFALIQFLADLQF